MNDVEMARMFSDLLKQVEDANKNMMMQNNTLVNLCDLIAQNIETNKNLEKVNINLGLIMAQGISKNTSVLAVDKAVDVLLRLVKK